MEICHILVISIYRPQHCLVANQTFEQNILSMNGLPIILCQKLDLTREDVVVCARMQVEMAMTALETSANHDL